MSIPTGVRIAYDGTAPSTPIEQGQISKPEFEENLHQLKRATALVYQGEAHAIVFTPLSKITMYGWDT
ncbi:hypothetical protein N7481_004605 [Penicillium waksmanii]|uniref:uncharacterized protein n=1 Tax=Penicillium waksmanii TaxID=69791 RepID=UPI0025490F68|nr:uncharacterized protein N7481_004605 [Penicillium waksmanii]KAJ5989395.1 hypothetical protein N7481_004605 [Penicillium waksmanii]